ncbi:18362_t:CDS:2, partial [Gigaspora rosea]
MVVTVLIGFIALGCCDEINRVMLRDNKVSIMECNSIINERVQLKKLEGYKRGQKEYKNETTFKKVVEVFKMRDRLEVKMYHKNSDLSYW